MKERKIQTEEAELTIRSPDKTTESLKKRMNAYKFINGRYLRITYVESEATITVITAVARKKSFEVSP